MTLLPRNEETLLATAGGNPEYSHLTALRLHQLQGHLAERGCWGGVKALWTTLLATIFPGQAPPPTAAEILAGVGSRAHSSSPLLAATRR